MTEREKLITAIERAREQSEEFGIGFIVVKLKETDLILNLLKEQPEQKHRQMYENPLDSLSEAELFEPMKHFQD